LSLDGSSVVRLLDNLETAGLIRRQEANDRRAKAIVLTDRGREVADQVEAVARRIREDALAGLSDADIETSFRVLDHVCRALATTVPETAP
jgi:MarR family transcriptional regulator for hemolysin